MEWLQDLINYGGQWAPLKIIFLGVMVVSGLWVYVDASSRTGNGCFWGAFAFAVPPIGVPFYYFCVLTMHIRNYDATFRSREEARTVNEKERKRITMMGDIEKQREEESRLETGGTMFDPTAGLGVSREGHQHFTDHHAEALLSELNHDMAWEYLIDLYRTAKNDNDGRAIDTYVHYISRIPGGLKRLQGQG